MASSSPATTFFDPGDAPATCAWEWNKANNLLALVDAEEALKVVNSSGSVIYRVQLPQEGRIIFLGWEPSGAALAAVQDHGGAFLWFPSKPDLSLIHI